MKYNLKGLSEREILTLREGLFCFYNSPYNNLNEKEFKELDNKFKEVFKNDN